MTSSIQNNSEKPIIFEEFFELGLNDEVSPFLTPTSRKWSQNLNLKTAIASAILLLIAFAMSFLPQYDPISKIFTITVYFLVGIPPLIDAIDDLLQLEINIDILMTLAAFSSFFLGGEIEGALLLVLFSISHAMEDTVANKAKSAINTLTKLTPSTAFVIEEDNKLIERSVKDIKIGSKLLVKSGSIVPLDGKIIKGISSLNLVHLTGENLPVTKTVGEIIPSGATNLEGVLEIEVIHGSQESTLSKIISLVTQAQEARPKLQLWFDKVSSQYASSIILFSFFFALIYPIIFDIPYLTQDGSIYRALSFLIAASPCALIIAVPIAYLSAISICAKNGILLKGGVTLDALASCKIFAFDKTGTLTYGKLILKNVITSDKTKQNKINFALSVAYGLERNAIHPIAEAIITYAKENHIDFYEIKNFKSIPGYGLEGEILIEDKIISCSIGNIEFIDQKISSEDSKFLHEEANKIKDDGDILATLLIGNDLYILHFNDQPRPYIKEILEHLRKKSKMRFLMLTGDHYKSAKKIANEMGIDEFYSDLRPEDKLRYVGMISQEEGLAMVGDGINDAPALARATVGICMGKIGSTTAVDAADIILLRDNIELIDWLIGKAHQTKKIVKQNLFIAVAAIFISSIPALLGMVPLWLAVIMHEGGTVLVGLNALRILKK